MRQCQECYLFDLQSNTVLEIPNMPVSSYYSAVGCILTTAYVINGYGHLKANEAYNIVTKEWTKIACCPVDWHANSGGVILNKICITALSESNAYIYDPTTNQYSAQFKIPGNNWKPVGSGFILTNSCMFQVQGIDLNNWKTIQYVSGTPDFSSYQGISHVFKRGRYLYAIEQYYNIWQIDTELFRVKKLVTH